MSIRVREWLMLMDLFQLITHEDRVDIDREIERRTGVYCDDAIEKGLVSKSEFKDIVYSVLGRKRKRREAIEAWLFRRFFHNIHVSTIKHD